MLFELSDFYTMLYFLLFLMNVVVAVMIVLVVVVDDGGSGCDGVCGCVLFSFISYVFKSPVNFKKF